MSNWDARRGDRCVSCGGGGSAELVRGLDGWGDGPVCGPCLVSLYNGAMRGLKASIRTRVTTPTGAAVLVRVRRVAADLRVHQRTMVNQGLAIEHAAQQLESLACELENGASVTSSASADGSPSLCGLCKVRPASHSLPRGLRCEDCYIGRSAEGQQESQAERLALAELRVRELERHKCPVGATAQQLRVVEGHVSNVLGELRWLRGADTA